MLTNQISEFEQTPTHYSTYFWMMYIEGLVGGGGPDPGDRGP